MFTSRSLHSGLLVVLIASTIVVALSVHRYAGAWNDGSRLATLECLVEDGTPCIDHSIFVDVPPAGPACPYRPKNTLLLEHGTLDKLLIHGHYYSDKSPVPAMMLAGVVEVWVSLGGPRPRERPDIFCLVINVISAGLAYLIFTAGLFVMAVRLGLSRNWSLCLTAVFGLGTLALPYAQSVNNHIILLGVAMLLFGIALEPGSFSSPGLLLLMGGLSGIAYTIDLGAGPPLTLSMAILNVVKQRGESARRRIIAILLFLSASLPWLILHHALNYAIGGTLGPANANAAYLDWPGSPFQGKLATGGWHHPSIGSFFLYALDLLFGKRGFLGHDLPLFLLLVAGPGLLRQRFPERAVLITGLAWSMATWMLYAVTSRNLAGQCCSIRWFVPLLAPAAIGLAVLLRDRPELRIDFLILGGWGCLLGAGMAWMGPWAEHMVPGYWFIYAGAIVSWGMYRFFRHRDGTSTDKRLKPRRKIGAIFLVWRSAAKR